MTLRSHVDSDPFADPSIHETQHDQVEESTLTVGRNASLTLGTDSLIVLGWCTSSALVVHVGTDYTIDEGFTRRETTNCCGILHSSTL